MKILFLTIIFHFCLRTVTCAANSDSREYFLLRSGKQILGRDSLQSKSTIIGIETDVVYPFLKRLQISYDMSPKVTNDSVFGTESISWTRATVGKPFLKVFQNSSVELTPKYRLTNYRSNLISVVDDQEVGIANLDIVNCNSIMAEIGFEKRWGNNWLRIFYSYGMTALPKNVIKVAEHQGGVHYYLAPFSTGSHFSALINFFAETDSFEFKMPSDEDETLDVKLRGKTIFLGVGLGFSF